MTRLFFPDYGPYKVNFIYNFEGPAARKMVECNSGLSQILSKVSLSKNMQLERTKYS